MLLLGALFQFWQAKFQ